MFFGTGVLLAILVNSLALRISAHDHQIQTTGDRTGSVHGMDQLDLVLSGLLTLCLSRLRHLITDGIQYNTGVIVVPIHHGSGILCPVIFKVQTIVILIFSVVPHIEGFIHDIHTAMVTGFQHGTGCRVMGGSNGIETGFLHDANSAPLTLIVGCGSQNTIVVMDTAAPKQRFLSIDEKALGTPLNFSDAELLLDHILTAV